MSDTTQSYANHVKWDPAFHFFLMPLLGINAAVCIMQAVRNPSSGSVWIAVLAIAAVVFVFKMRLYSLKVQDRVIRLEERLRLSQLLNPPLRDRIGELTESQLIALRFASDAEVPGLASTAISNRQPAADIKKSIKTWRADRFRV